MHDVSCSDTLLYIDHIHFQLVITHKQNNVTVLPSLLLQPSVASLIHHAVDYMSTLCGVLN